MTLTLPTRSKKWTALRTLSEFDAEVKGKPIKLDQTFTNAFVQKANAKYK